VIVEGENGIGRRGIKKKECVLGSGCGVMRFNDDDDDDDSSSWRLCLPWGATCHPRHQVVTLRRET
jgi:hypothetical protein